MADKSFGVDQLDILGTGTPTISAPNQLNLDAHTVAISTSVTVGEGMSAVNISATGITTITVPANANPHSSWDVVNNSASAYRFTGPGQDGAEDNPNIYLVRGQRYVFKMNASGHPFQIRVANGGAAYSDGVTNNGAQTGNVVFNVQHDAPAQLFYQCTAHGGMVGNIYIVGGPQVISGVVTATTFVGNLTGNVTGTASANAVLTGSTNNQLVTVTGANAITGESGLTFSSDRLILTNTSTPQIRINNDTSDGSGTRFVLGKATANNNFINGAVSGDSCIGFPSNLLFGVGASEKLRIGSSGQIGIAGANYGTAGQVIKSTGASSAPVWASGGKAIQYSTDYKTDEQNTGSTSWQTINGLARTVTPKNASSRFLLLFMATGQTNGGRISLDIAYSATGITNDRIGNSLGEFAMMSSEQNSGQNIPLHMHWVHHPNTANAVTYTPQFRGSGSNTVIIGASNHPSHFTVIELEG